MPRKTPNWDREEILFLIDTWLKLKNKDKEFNGRFSEGKKEIHSEFCKSRLYSFRTERAVSDLIDKLTNWYRMVTDWDLKASNYEHTEGHSWFNLPVEEQKTELKKKFISKVINAQEFYYKLHDIFSENHDLYPSHYRSIGDTANNYSSGNQVDKVIVSNEENSTGNIDIRENKRKRIVQDLNITSREDILSLFKEIGEIQLENLKKANDDFIKKYKEMIYNDIARSNSVLCDLMIKKFRKETLKQRDGEES